MTISEQRIFDQYENYWKAKTENHTEWRCWTIWITQTSLPKKALCLICDDDLSSLPSLWLSYISLNYIYIIIQFEMKSFMWKLWEYAVSIAWWLLILPIWVAFVVIDIYRIIIIYPIIRITTKRKVKRFSYTKKLFEWDL